MGYALLFSVVGMIAAVLHLVGVADQISWVLYLIGIALVAIHVIRGRTARVTRVGL